MEETKLLTYSEIKLLTFWKEADRHLQEDLFALKHWRDYAHYKKHNDEQVNEFYKPQPDDKKPVEKVKDKHETVYVFTDKPEDKTEKLDKSKSVKNKDKKEDKTTFVFTVKKTLLERLARCHYFFEFLFVAILCAIYFLNFGFKLASLFIVIPLAILVVVTLIFFITNIVCSLRIQTHIDLLDMFKYVILRMGEPGTGKSSSGIYDAVEIAKKLWKQLQFDYWKIKNKIERIYSGTHLEHYFELNKETGKMELKYKRVYTGDKEKIRHAVEIVEAYEFYSSHNGVPCLWSNIPVFVDGKPAYIFTTDHLMQKKKVLLKGIAFIDEIGSMLPPELSRNKDEQIDLMFRFCRHFKEWHIISTEQDGNATLISARRVTAENRRMLEQKHILKPIILNWLTSLIERKIQCKEPTDQRVKFISNLRFYVDSVGFRKFKFEDYGNLQVGNKGDVSSRIKSFIAPPHLNCYYDDRTFRNLYACLNESAIAETFKSPVLSLEEIKKLFNQDLLDKAYKKKRKQSIEKKEKKDE